MILTEGNTQHLYTLTLRENGSLIIIESVKSKSLKEATLTLLKRINQKYYKNSWKQPKYILENIRDISITETGLYKETKYFREELLYTINTNTY